MTRQPGPVVRAVGAVVLDGEGRLLLVRRAHEPARGLWSVPGGRVEPGETDRAALVREVREETGLTVRVDRYLGGVCRPAPTGGTYDIHDYLAVPVGEEAGRDPVAGDDAADARWVSGEGLAGLSLVEGLRDALREWGVQLG